MRFTHGALLLLPLILLSCSQTPKPAKETATGDFFVEVVDREDGRRIGFPSVYLEGMDGSETWIWARHVSLVPAGSYIVKVGAEGYAPEREICVVAPGLTTELVFELTRLPDEVR